MFSFTLTTAVAAVVDVDGGAVDHVVLVLEPRGELALLHRRQARVGVRVTLPGQHLLKGRGGKAIRKGAAEGCIWPSAANLAFGTF